MRENLMNSGWAGGAKVLGKLPSPRRPTVWNTVGQGPYALAVGTGGGCLEIFTPIYPFFPLSPGGGRLVRWCWVNFQCRGVLQLDYSWARDYCTCSRCGWGLFGHFYSRLSFLFSFSLSLGDGPI